MITFISGVPGSGKTYLAITYMLKEKKPICTNIDIKKDIEVNRFDWNIFYRKISILYKYRNDADRTIRYSKRLGLFNIAIYYDECHLELGTQKKIVIWWLSWHRHLDQTIYLITQSKSTLAQKYRAYPEIFVDAHPASKRLFSKVMRYTEFADFRMNKDSTIRKFSIKIDPKIFEVYRTGASNQGTSSLRKKLYMILLFMLVPIGMFYYILHMYSNDVPDQIEDHNTTIDNNITKHVSISPKIRVKKEILVEISGKWVNYKGWLFSVQHPMIKEMLSIPHKTHTVSVGYHRLRYDDKYLTFFDVLIADRGI